MSLENSYAYSPPTQHTWRCTCAFSFDPLVLLQDRRVSSQPGKLSPRKACHWSKVTQLVHGRAWFPTAKPTPFGQCLSSAGKDFCLPPIFWKAGCQQQVSSNATHLFLGEWGRSTLQRTEKEKTEEQNECLSHQEGEASFSPEPHTPEGRNPMRGSEFHENEPQSLHRLIQISQLHISESLPHPSKPQPQVLTLCPHLCLLAQNRGRKLRLQGVCTLH